MSQNNRTAGNFEMDMVAFLAYVNMVTKEVAGQRQRFPGFRLTTVIMSKMQAANGCLADADLNGAFDRLEDAQRHFDCQQAAYARKELLGRLQGAQDQMIKKRFPIDLVKQADEPVKAYEELMKQGRFDLEEASKLFWAAADAIDAAYAELEVRREDEERVRREATSREKCGAVANRLANLIGQAA